MSVSAKDRQRGRELSGRCSGSCWMSVSDVVSCVLSQSRACVTGAPERRGLQGEHRRNSFQAVLIDNLHQASFFNIQIYFAGCHLFVTLQKQPTDFCYIYLSCSWQVHPLLSVWIIFYLVLNAVFDRFGPAWLLAFWLKIPAVTPQQTIWEAFLLHCQCIPLFRISVVL